MRKNPFSSEKCARVINTFRIEKNGGEFTKEELLAKLKEHKLPANSTWWSELLKSGIIKKVGKNAFIFSSSEPVFHGIFVEIYRKYQAIRKKYNCKKTDDKPTLESAPEPEVKEESTPESEEDDFNTEEFVALESFAIDFLKELGYKIFKPVSTVYQLA